MKLIKQIQKLLQMTIANFANQFIFPVLLFAIFLGILNLETLPFNNVAPKAEFNLELEHFYEVAEQEELELIFESVSTHLELIDKITEYAKLLGCKITTQDIVSSIEEYTHESQVDYICLPIGCFSPAS